MKIIAIGASTSANSINRRFANYAANLVPNAEVTDIDLSKLQVPLFSVDEEEAHGIPPVIKNLIDTIESHDAVVISFAEHNGSYAAAYKNIFDWASREQYKVWGGKPTLLLATSPGARGGATVLEAAKTTYPHLGAEVKASFSLPSYFDNFTNGTISNSKLKEELQKAIQAFAS